MCYLWKCKVHRICTFPPEGAGRFSVALWSSEGVVRRSSVTARISTADSTLMGGDCDSHGSYVSIVNS